MHGVHFTSVVSFALYIEYLVIADGQPNVPVPFQEIKNSEFLLFHLNCIKSFYKSSPICLDLQILQV